MLNSPCEVHMGHIASNYLRDGAYCSPCLCSGYGKSPPKYEYAWGERRPVIEIDRDSHILFTFIVVFQLKYLLKNSLDANHFLNLLMKYPIISYPKLGNL